MPAARLGLTCSPPRKGSHPSQAGDGLNCHEFCRLVSDRVVVLSAGPATRPIGDFKVDLPRPRDVSEIRMTPAFATLHREIWAAMKEEVLKAYAAQKVA